MAWSLSATSPADISFAKGIVGKLLGGDFTEGANTWFGNAASQPVTPQEQVYANSIPFYWFSLDQRFLTLITLMTQALTITMFHHENALILIKATPYTGPK